MFEKGGKFFADWRDAKGNRNHAGGEGLLLLLPKVSYGQPSLTTNHPSLSLIRRR
jgi:hypothetical protein